VSVVLWRVLRYAVVGRSAACLAQGGLGGVVLEGSQRAHRGCVALEAALVRAQRKAARLEPFALGYSSEGEEAREGKEG